MIFLFRTTFHGHLSKSYQDIQAELKFWTNGPKDEWTDSRSPNSPFPFVKKKKEKQVVVYSFDSPVVSTNTPFSPSSPLSPHKTSKSYESKMAIKNV